LAFVRDNKIESFLEVGCGRGDSFHEICLQMPKASTAVAIDFPDNGWGFENGSDLIIAAMTDLTLKGYNAYLKFEDSRHRDSINFAKKHAPFDLIFIDGDHTYEGVKADFDNYSPMGRFIAFHDIANDMKRNSKGELIEVPVFWNELKQEYKHWEFIVDGSNMGIGVIEV